MTPPRYPRNATPAGIEPAHTYAEILAENPVMERELLDELEELAA